MPDRVYGQMAHTFLPAIVPGMLGLFIAALLAGVMSSCDSFMIASSALVTENLYKPLAPDKTPQHYVFVGRVFALVIVFVGVLVAFRMPDVVAGLKTWLKIAPMLGISFWLGLLWRRFNAAGAWTSTLAGFAAWWLTLQPGFISCVAKFSISERLGIIRDARGEPAIYDPWQILFYLSVAVIVGVAASLLTKRPDGAAIGRFHDLIRTPVGTGEVIARPCHLPPGVEPAQRRSWFPGTDFEIPAPSRTSVIGFAICWIAVGAMIGGFAWLLRA